MNSFHKVAFNNILIALKDDLRVVNSSRIGLCRLWTKEAISVVSSINQGNNLKIFCEAREIDLEPGVSHTFLYLWIVTGENVSRYILDGTGTAIHSPYFGEADLAPLHLQDSRIDMIERYRELGGFYDRYDNDSSSVQYGVDE